MHIFSGRKERIRFYSLQTSIKSQTPRATDLCIHARLGAEILQNRQKCNEIKQKQKRKKNHRQLYNIFSLISMFKHGYNALSGHFLNSPKISTSRQSTQPPSHHLFGFVPVVFTFSVIIDIAQYINVNILCILYLMAFRNLSTKIS